MRQLLKSGKNIWRKESKVKVVRALMFTCPEDKPKPNVAREAEWWQREEGRLRQELEGAGRELSCGCPSGTWKQQPKRKVAVKLLMTYCDGRSKSLNWRKPWLSCSIFWNEEVLLVQAGHDEKVIAWCLASRPWAFRVACHRPPQPWTVLPPGSFHSSEPPQGASGERAGPVLTELTCGFYRIC